VALFVVVSLLLVPALRPAHPSAPPRAVGAGSPRDGR
jgi:hypothetical protein